MLLPSTPVRLSRGLPSLFILSFCFFSLFLIFNICMLTVLTHVNLSTRFPFCLISTPFHLPFFLLIATEGFGSSSTHQAPQTHTCSHKMSHSPNRERNYKVRINLWKMPVWTGPVDVDSSGQNKLNWNHLLYWCSAFNYPLMRQRQWDGLWDGNRESHCESNKKREDDGEEGGRTGGRDLGFCLVAITVQSGRNVCGTKWSVMGNRLLQLHI